MDLKWKLGDSDGYSTNCKEYYEASVPGCVQLDYAKKYGLPPVNYGNNYKEYNFLEKKYFNYKTKAFIKKSDKTPYFILEQCDYQYDVLINGNKMLSYEGLNGKHILDLSEYTDTEICIDIVFYPPPMADYTPLPNDDAAGERFQAAECVKPAVSYGWDWHPRLIPIGIYKKAAIEYRGGDHVYDFTVNYELSDDFKTAEVDVSVKTFSNNSDVNVLLKQNGDIVCEKAQTVDKNGVISFTVDNPMLWYPIGYGEQNLYIIEIKTKTDSIKKQIGFRQSKLLLNEGEHTLHDGFPSSRSKYPITLYINNVKIFAKGANWVNSDIFMSEVTRERYASLINLAKDCNMNILRCWGGASVDFDDFFELCDEAGIIVWQEFPLSCNDYPDDKKYLNTLETEAKQILDRISGFPCVCILCGGNELFCNWSGMDDQSLPIRLLDSICYKREPHIPFMATSPLEGMGHGNYINIDENDKESIIGYINSRMTAYTEFGCPGASPPDYIRTFMTNEEFNELSTDKNSIWTKHHAFNAWWCGGWLRPNEVEYYFGGYDSVEDLINKSRIVQAVCYKAYFEEMRKQAPLCSMAVCWCYNEPWPTAANNSIINYPDIPKKCYYTVKDALRPVMTSLRCNKLLWLSNEEFSAELWLLNDSLDDIPNKNIEVFFVINDKKQKIMTWHFDKTEKQRHKKGPTVTFTVEPCCDFKILLVCEDEPSINSEYTFFCKSTDKKAYAGSLNVNLD